MAAERNCGTPSGPRGSISRLATRGFGNVSGDVVGHQPQADGVLECDAESHPGPPLGGPGHASRGPCRRTSARRVGLSPPLAPARPAGHTAGTLGGRVAHGQHERRTNRQRRRPAQVAEEVRAGAEAMRLAAEKGRRAETERDTEEGVRDRREAGACSPRSPQTAERLREQTEANRQAVEALREQAEENRRAAEELRAAAAESREITPNCGPPTGRWWTRCGGCGRSPPSPIVQHSATPWPTANARTNCVTPACAVRLTALVKATRPCSRPRPRTRLRSRLWSRAFDFIGCGPPGTT